MRKNLDGKDGQIPDVNKHLIVVGSDGEPLKPVRCNPPAATRPEFDSHVSTILRGLEEEPHGKILIFIHGGLNTYAQSFDRALRLIPLIKNAGYYPIFVNWRSGLVDCYREHLFSVRQGRIHRNYGWLTWLYLLTADLGRAVFRSPAAIYLQIINDCKPYFPRSNPDGLNSAALFDALRKRRRSARDVEALGISMGADVRTRRESLVKLLLLLITYFPKLFSGAVVDAFGTSAWVNMLRRTKTLFRTPQEFDVRDSREKHTVIEGALDTPQTGALALFVTALVEKLDSGARPYEIIIVGHSMGTIVLNRVLKDFPGLACSNLVYLAAACSISEFIDSTVSYLDLHKQTRVFNLCLHPIAEELESNALELSPRGSLLVWIDNFMSSPETTADRRLGVWENILQATHMIPHHFRGRITLKAFSVGRNAGGPQTHSELGSIDFWSPGVWEADN
jgi:pimeloyl-ACP methyl ester carboxylesterase